MWTAAGTRLALNGYPQTLGDLSGSGSIDLGSGSGALTFGDTSSQTFSGTISGSGGFDLRRQRDHHPLGHEHVHRAVNINAGYLQVAADANLGSLSNGINLNGGGLATTASFTSSRNIRWAPIMARC